MTSRPPDLPVSITGVDVAGGQLPVATAGAGFPLVMLHGWTLDQRMWLPQVDGLGRDFHLIMPDRRGFGRSSAPPDLAREWKDVEHLADALGLDEFALLGLSQGAVIALDCASKLGGRIAALVVSGAPLPELVEREETLDRDHFTDLVRAGKIDQMRCEWAGHELMHHANPATDALVEQILADYDGRDLLVPSVIPELWPETLARLDVPVMALAGAGENQWRQKCAQRLAEVVSHGKFELVEGAGHLANLDRPVDFNRLVREFLGNSALPAQ